MALGAVALLVLAAVAAGLVDAIAGGGGLIALPALAYPAIRLGRRLRRAATGGVLMDVNLREPHWNPTFVTELMSGATLVKLNEFELAALAPGRQEAGDIINFFSVELDRLGVDLRLETPLTQARVDALVPDTVDKSFRKLLKDRRDRKEDFFHHKPPRVLDVCQVPVGGRLIR